MTERHRPSGGGSSSWPYAVVGGLVSVPLTVAYNWRVAAGTEFSVGLVIVGGLLAGLLAHRASSDAVRAGFGAGVIGSLVAYGWVLPALLDTASDFGAAWSFPPATVVLALLFSVVVLGVGGVVGLLGGVVGRWLAGLLGRVESSPTGT